MSLSLSLIRKTVGEFCDEFGGAAQTGPFGSQLHSSDYVENGTPVVMPKDIVNGCISSRRIARVGTEHVKRLAKHKLQLADVVFSRRGDVGRFAVVEQEQEGWLCGTGCLRIRFGAAPLDARYLRHYFSQRVVRDWLLHAAQGVTMPNMNTKILRSLPIDAPPLPEQKRIAAILDKADEIRRKRAETIKLADDFLKSTFLDMFGDPVENPKGWKPCSLRDHYSSEKEGTKCGPFGGALKKSEYVDSGVPVWNMDNIADNGERKGDPSLWIQEEKFEELRAYSVADGDIIISRAGTVGKMCVIRGVTGDSIISTNLIRLRLADSLRPEFFVALMTFCKGRVGRLKTGPDGAFTHMSTGVLDTLTFPYPPPEIQERYVRILRTVRRMAEHASSAAASLNDLFRSLSQRAFQGTL